MQDGALSGTMRHAVYYAPPAGHALHRLGSAWLGRDALAGRDLRQEPVDGPSPDELRAWTASARRYGLHATLKPPFRLAAGMDPEWLCAAMAALADRHGPVEIRLRLASIDGFLALLPCDPVPPALPALAAACVADLDAFRAAPAAAELARRRGAGLTSRQEELLQRWGYPHVMEEFRFHITLTDRLPPVQAGTLMPILAERFAAVLAHPLCLDSLSLFAEPEEGAPLVEQHRFPLRAPARFQPARSLPDGTNP